MSEYISDGSTMSDATQLSRIADDGVEGGNKNWVQFDEANGADGPHKSLSADTTPTRNVGGRASSQTTTSGVSSARGSVNSLPQQGHSKSSNAPASPEGAHLSVSEIQVIHFIKIVHYIRYKCRKIKRLIH